MAETMWTPNSIFAPDIRMWMMNACVTASGFSSFSFLCRSFCHSLGAGTFRFRQCNYLFDSDGIDSICILQEQTTTKTHTFPQSIIAAHFARIANKTRRNLMASIISYFRLTLHPHFRIEFYSKSFSVYTEVVVTKPLNMFRNKSRWNEK